MNITSHEILVYIPLVREDVPEWKKVCPFCGAYDLVHEADGFYICHACLANWLENDTPTERQIQVLHLNYGTMPVPGEGEMPIVFREIERHISTTEISLKNETVTFRNRKRNVYAVRNLWEWYEELFGKGGHYHAEHACA